MSTVKTSHYSPTGILAQLLDELLDISELKRFLYVDSATSEIANEISWDGPGTITTLEIAQKLMRRGLVDLALQRLIQVRPLRVREIEGVRKQIHSESSSQNWQMIVPEGTICVRAIKKLEHSAEDVYRELRNNHCEVHQQAAPIYNVRRIWQEARDPGLWAGSLWDAKEFNLATQIGETLQLLDREWALSLVSHHGLMIADDAHHMIFFTLSNLVVEFKSVEIVRSCENGAEYEMQHVTRTYPACSPDGAREELARTTLTRLLMYAENDMKRYANEVSRVISSRLDGSVPLNR